MNKLQKENDETAAPPQPAYGDDGVPNSELTSENRIDLFRIATHARKAGFVFNSQKTAWKLTSPTMIQRFIKRELPAWRHRWRVDNLNAIYHLGHELAPLKMFIDVDAAQQNDTGEKKSSEMNWRYRFQIAGEWLPDDIVRRLFADRDSAIVIPKRGIARLDARQQRLLENFSKLPQTLPRYTLISLFTEERVHLNLSPELEKWRQDLLNEPEAKMTLPEFLRPYQARGVAWLAHMLSLDTHPLLADEMGLGKTVQILSLLDLKPRMAPVIIVCPASVIPVWQSEIARFFPKMSVGVLQRGSDFVSDRESKIWLASYNQLRRNKTLLAQVSFSHAILDEAQYIKNPDAKVTDACLAIRAECRVALTGTPVENHPLDIWSIFRFLMPGLLGTRKAFEERLNTDSRAISRIAKQVAPFILRRTKNVVAADLPPKLTVPLLCPMGDSQRETYKRLVEEGVAALGDIAPESILSKQSMSFFALLTRLRQAACDAGLLPGHESVPVLDSGKISLLIERLSEILENDRKVVIFSQFVTLLNRVEAALKEKFPPVPLFKLTGSTVDRMAPVASFQETIGAGIILVSLRAGGTGITLNSAEYVFLLDPWWNPAVEAQAIDRVHRIGQKNATFVYRMISADTIEARIETLKAMKSELFANVVDGIPDMSDWSAHFPSLRALIS